MDGQMRVVLISLTLVAMTTVIAGEKDLNEHQVQFVADHLTVTECDQLMAALHTKSFQVDRGYLNSARHSDVPCVKRLLQWNKTAKNGAFELLTLRLREIQKPRLADKLSHSVFQETADAIRKYFLDDPFKEMIPEKSILLDVPAPTTGDYVSVDTADPIGRSTFIASVVCGCFALIVIVCFAVMFCCPGLCTNLFERFAPVPVVVCCAKWSDEATFRWRRFQKHFSEHVLEDKKAREENEILI